MDYTKFTVIDFVCDEYFQNWVLNPDQETERFWKTWLLENADKREIVKEARDLILHIRFREDFPTDEQTARAFRANLAVIGSLEREKEKENAKIIALNRLRKIFRIAAVVTGIFLTGAIIWYNAYWNARTVVTTKYGEIKTIVLPDSSLITLNANSEISYFTRWRKSDARNVWLKGEAFLAVKHLNKNENKINRSDRFFVHVGDMDIEVLGTSFDVKNRRNVTDVVLESGKIRLLFKDKPEIIMEPGDRITYNAAHKKISRTVTNPAIHTSWTTKKLILTDAPVADIIQYIEDNYGYKVVLEDNSISLRRMEGTMLLDNLQDVLFVMSTTLDVKIETRDSTLIFRPNK
jgi:ferric-dicitrate binding protein FerR (iron transport regulator)